MYISIPILQYDTTVDTTWHNMICHIITHHMISSHIIYQHHTQHMNNLYNKDTRIRLYVCPYHFHIIPASTPITSTHQAHNLNIIVADTTLCFRYHLSHHIISRHIIPYHIISHQYDVIQSYVVSNEDNMHNMSAIK